MSSNKVWDISRALLLLHNPPIHLLPHKEGTARSSPLFKRNGTLQIMQIVKQIKAIFQIFMVSIQNMLVPTGPRICRAIKLQQLERVSTVWSSF